VNELSRKTFVIKRAGRHPCSSGWTPLTGSSSSSRAEEMSAEAGRIPQSGRRTVAAGSHPQ
jgi:hypothetical protein